MHRASRIILAASCLALAAFARADDGAALFAAHGCDSCHRVGERGGSAGPDLTLAGFRRPRGWLERWLRSPHAWKPDTLMPEQGLSDADRDALAGYLSAQKGGAWGGERPWAALTGAARGRAIYVRAGCVACHGAAGRGGHPNPGARGDVIPALAPLMGTYTSDELKRKIQDGVLPDGHDGLSPAVVMPAWKDVLSDEELDSLTAYLLSLAESQPKSDW